MQKPALLCLFVIFFITGTVWGQVNVGDSGTLSGRVYADYYWMALSHDNDLEGNNGFWFRRIYFTYDTQINDSFSGRLRLEMNSEGDFMTDSELVPAVKDAYLKWSNDNHSILAGISSTPTFGLTEDIWGYRSVEKSPLDLFDFGSSRDFGIALQGKLDKADRLNYHFMVANGSGDGTELNKGKKLMLALSYELTEHVVIQGYGDWNDNFGNTDAYTGQIVLGYMSDDFSIGGLYAHQLRENATGGEDLKLDLASVFANSSVNENMNIFARVDRLFDPNPSGPGNAYVPMSDQAEPTFLSTGVDIALEENIRLIPNIEAIIYSENEAGFKPEPDLIPRLTLFYRF